MREAKRWRVDVLLLQELNVDPKQVDKYKRAAERVGFWLAVSCKGTGAHRGGTAVAVRCEHSVLAQREPRAHGSSGRHGLRSDSWSASAVCLPPMLYIIFMLSYHASDNATNRDGRVTQETGAIFHITRSHLIGGATA